jgi:methyl-accepting chemotaxis protein
MDFDQAITAHVGWKTKLSHYLARPDGSLKAADVAGDHNCDLGKWIYGEGAKFSSLPEFSKLKQEHAHFHQSAAAVIAKADRGEQVSDEVALGGKSQFALSSNAVVTALMDMKHKAGK